MKKIISLFQRNYDGNRLVRDEIVPGAEWVMAGEGRATRKWNGTCCMIRGGKLFKRYEVKQGEIPPPDFIPANDVDENTSKQQGWRPVGDGPEDKYHREAVVLGAKGTLAENGNSMVGFNRLFPDGTYELCGPKIQGNQDSFTTHCLVPHGASLYTEDKDGGQKAKEYLSDVPRTFDGLKTWLACHAIGGIVWHHPDGRMVKIKAKDFGYHLSKIHRRVTRAGMLK